MKRRVLWLLALSLSFAGVVRGDAGLTLYGDTTFGQSYNRPDDLITLSGANVRFSAQPFFPNADATCTIYSTQEGNDYDGHLALYQGSFNRLAPLNNLIAVNDDHRTDNQGLGVGTSRILKVDLQFNEDYILVTSGYVGSDFGTFTNHIQCEDPATRVLPGDGVFVGNTYDGRVAELFGGRFQVWVEFEDFSHVLHDAYSVPVGSSDSALFWFFQPANWELLIKIANGCGLNGHYWVYLAATTNVGFTVYILDTFTGEIEFQVHNPLGTQTNTSVANINAIGNCP